MCVSNCNLILKKKQSSGLWDTARGTEVSWLSAKHLQDCWTHLLVFAIGVCFGIVPGCVLLIQNHSVIPLMSDPVEDAAFRG